MAKRQMTKAKSSPEKGHARRMTVQARALQKIRENYKNLSSDSCYVLKCTDTGLTLQQQIEADILRKDQGADLKFGKLYHNVLAEAYCDIDTVFGQLKPDAADLPVADEFLEASLVLFNRCAHSAGPRP